MPRGMFQLNLVWSGVLLAMILPNTVANFPAIVPLIVLGLALLHLGVSILAVRRNRIALRLVIVAPVLAILRWLPVVVINWWMYEAGDPLFQDSPGVNIIVVLIAIVFVIPPGIFCAMYFKHRRAIWAAGGPEQTMPVQP